MKKVSVLLVLSLILGLLAGCTGAPEVYPTEYDSPEGELTDAHAPSVDEKPQPERPVVTEGPLKTGLYIGASVTGNQLDVIMVAVLVDDSGVIADCVIEGYSENIVTYEDFGLITNSRKAKHSVADSAIVEWSEQAAAMTKYAIGKTIDELKNGSIDGSGYAAEGIDPASSAAMCSMAGIEAAVARAQHLGAQSGDILKMEVDGFIGVEKDVNLDGAAVSMNGDRITSCVIDELIAWSPYANLQSRNQLGENDTWNLFSSLGTEWYEQAAIFAAYVTGMTAAEVDGIAVDAYGCPAEVGLIGSVDFGINRFQWLIVDACNQ